MLNIYVKPDTAQLLQWIKKMYGWKNRMEIIYVTKQREFYYLAVTYEVVDIMEPLNKHIENYADTLCHSAI